VDALDDLAVVTNDLDGSEEPQCVRDRISSSQEKLKEGTGPSVISPLCAGIAAA